MLRHASASLVWFIFHNSCSSFAPCWSELLALYVCNLFLRFENVMMMPDKKERFVNYTVQDASVIPEAFTVVSGSIFIGDDITVTNRG